MIFKNALLSIKKNIGRTVLLFVIILLIVNLVMAGFSIKNATEKSMVAAREALGSDVTLSYNMQYLMKNRTKGSAMDTVSTSIKVSDANKLKSLKYVSSVNYSQTVSVDTDDIDPVKTTTESSSSSSSNSYQPDMPQGESNDSSKKMMDNNNFTVSGNTTMATLSVFTNENYVLSKGRLLSESDAGTKNTVISSDLAKDNDLSVGDTFTVTATDSDDNETTVKLKIVGIYKIKTTTQMGGMSNRQSPYNTLYTSLETAQKLNGSTKTISSAIYTLDDPDHIDEFEALAKKTSINWNKFTLDADDRAYEMSVSSLENMNTFASIFLGVVIVVGAAILALILILTLKSRFYEFGIFLSMGQSKLKIIGQQLIEVGFIAVIAFMLSLGTGQLVANTVSNMLETTSTSAPSVTMNMNDNKSSSSSSSSSSSKSSSNSGGKDFMQNAMNKPTNTDLDVSLTTKTASQLAGVTAGICFIAILVPSIAVLRLSPRKILMKKEG